jgi:protein-L-isoaspartate(D-aspartate) O-methyltransferase
VVTVERIASLLDNARKILLDPDPGNVRFRIGDGTMGVPEEAPFQRIIVTAAAPKVPTPLFEQLAEGGIMVIPVGERLEQELLMVQKERGRMRKEILGGCRFVPLIGQCGFHE